MLETSAGEKKENAMEQQDQRQNVSHDVHARQRVLLVRADVVGVAATNPMVP
jgi:hypothetical protein